MIRSWRTRSGLLLASMIVMVSMAGCGFERLHAVLPAEVQGLTLADLKLIQNDTRLTDAQKRDQIRQAVGAPDDENGDRLVEFLLTFNVP
jgi:hypothetical protein